MNKNSLHLIAFSILAFALVMACKKNDDNSSTITDVNKSDVSMFSALRSAPQTFTVTAGIGKKIKGASGTLLEFYPNSFMDKNGNILTSGTVNIELTEMYSVGEMIANRTSTTTSYGVLNSGGEVNIKATMGGQEVFANKYRIGFKASSNVQNKPMSLYVKGENNTDSITVWAITKMGSLLQSSLITDTSWSLIEAPYFIFDSCSTFKMINCDHPYDSTSKNVTITVKFGVNSFKQACGSLSVSFASLNVATILFASQYNANSNEMTFKGWVPTGPACKFALMIPKDVNNFYYFEQSGNVTNDMAIEANVTLLSKADLQAKLRAL